LAAQERGLEVDCEGNIEVGLGQLFQLAAQRDAGVVDQHVDGAEHFLDATDKARDRMAIGDIGVERDAATSESANRSDSACASAVRRR
jgi:hypothetical protein